MRKMLIGGLAALTAGVLTLGTPIAAHAAETSTTPTADSVCQALPDLATSVGDQLTELATTISDAQAKLTTATSALGPALDNVVQALVDSVHAQDGAGSVPATSAIVGARFTQFIDAVVAWSTARTAVFNAEGDQQIAQLTQNLVSGLSDGLTCVPA